MSVWSRLPARRVADTETLEYFGFLIISSQTLNVVPDVDGKVYWTPVNDIAGALSDLVILDCTLYPVYHIENPIGQP